MGGGPFLVATLERVLDCIRALSARLQPFARLFDLGVGGGILEACPAAPRQQPSPFEPKPSKTLWQRIWIVRAAVGSVWPTWGAHTGPNHILIRVLNTQPVLVFCLDRGGNKSTKKKIYIYFTTSRKENVFSLQLFQKTNEHLLICFLTIFTTWTCTSF